MIELSKDIIFYVDIAKFAMSVAIFFLVGKFTSYKPDFGKKGAGMSYPDRFAYHYKVAPLKGKAAFWCAIGFAVAVIALQLLVTQAKS